MITAGTLEQIFAIETAVETAIRGLLKAAGHETYFEFSDAGKEPPFFDVQLTNVIEEGHVKSLNGEHLPAAWNAQLVLRIVTLRGLSSDGHSAMIGSARLTAARNRHGVPVDLLPLHEIRFLPGSSVTRGIDEDLGIDWSAIVFPVLVAVRDEAWPERV